ncbi:MAG: amidohydrolase [Chloroflexota bacterium]|nr:amidohydrolase [Chloroflexota bacterium]
MARALLIHNGSILTMDPTRPEVEAVALAHGVVVATGSLSEARTALPGRYEEIDLQGRFACPGLIDAHAHVMGVGWAALDLDLRSPPNESIADLVSLVAQAARSAPEGTWIQGRGYDQASLREQRHPTRQDLDAVAPDHPVWLIRSCHHIAVANSRALATAGITASTADPPGGTIDRDAHGEPTGVLRESAMRLVVEQRGDPSEEEIVAAIEAGGSAFRRAGVTSVHEAGIGDATELRAYQRLRQRGRLPIRAYLMMRINDTYEELAALGVMSGLGDDWLRIGNAKLFLDGSIGGRTARMRTPYQGEDGNYGLWMEEPEVITRKVIEAHKAGFQVGCHAIGDAAISLLLDAYEQAQQAAPRSNARHRIEHCSILDGGLLDRIARLHVVPIPGTTFLNATRNAYVQNLGLDRLRYTYPMKTFAVRGIVAAASSDAPIISLNPLLGVQTMVTRRDRTGAPVWTEEAISVEEALRAYTVHGAYASFEEQHKGTLRTGMIADVTIMAADPRQVAPDEIASVAVDYTVMDGEVVWERTSSGTA